MIRVKITKELREKVKNKILEFEELLKEYRKKMEKKEFVNLEKASTIELKWEDLKGLLEFSWIHKNKQWCNQLDLYFLERAGLLDEELNKEQKANEKNNKLV